MTRLWLRMALASAALLLVAGIVSGCSDDGTVTQQPAAPAADTGAEATPVTTATPDAATASDVAATATTTASVPAETRAEILLLAGQQLDGQQFDLAATAGNDVLLWFWAPW